MAISHRDVNGKKPETTDLTAETDAKALLERMWQGDSTALDTLLAVYWQPLVRYAHAVVQNVDAAEDVVQDVFVNLWHNRTRWQSIGSIRSYLYRSTRNRALNEARDHRVRSDLIRAHGRVEPSPATPLEVLHHTELHRAAEAAIQALSPRRREVFILFSRHNLSYREISRVMGISYQTVANHMSAALRSLRQSLSSFLDEESALGSVETSDQRGGRSADW